MTDLREAEAREEAWHLWRVGHLGGFPREAFAAGFDAGRATEAARYRDEAMVERVAEALATGDPVWAMENANWPNLAEDDIERYRGMARAALAVIAEPAEGNSTVG